MHVARRSWGIVAVGLFLLTIVSTATAKYSGGTGEPNDPYQIATAADLIALGETPADYDKHFLLTADIDLDPNLPGRKVFDRAVIAPDTDDVHSSFQGSAFSGVFDGDGHTISHLTILGAYGLGLFGRLGSGAMISNLGLEFVDVNGTDSVVGSLAGSNGGTIINSYSTGSVSSTGDYVGGLVGGNYRTVYECFSTAAVGGQDMVGGLAGLNLSVVVRCYSTGAVNGQCDVGGLVGRSDNGYGYVSHCWATGAVAGTSRVGGLVGSNGDFVEYCYATGDVTGDQQAGGLIGSNGNAVIDSFSTGPVAGGGLVGQNSGGVYNSFWDIESSGATTSAGGVGKTTADMKRAATFLGWGCEPAWTIEEGEGYPRLLWEGGAGEPIRGCSLWQGSGTEDDPFLIQTAQDLNTVAQMPHVWDKCFRLASDVDLSEFADEFNAIGMSTMPFRGTFDGGGHTISNLHLSRTNTSYLGLFGYVEGQIEHLRLVDPNVQGASYVGALAGWLSAGTITDCHVENGSVFGNGWVGGLVGWNCDTVSRCYSESTVSGGDLVGGLVGANNCCSSVVQCCSAGAVSGEECVGGLVGLNDGTVIQCFSTGSVKADWAVGGLVGNISAGYLSHCYSAGWVTGDTNVGGLVGYGDLCCTESNCFWDVETSGQSTSAGGTGKTNAEMQTADTFLDAGWDFVGELENGLHEIWQMPEGGAYPVLALFNGYTPPRLRGEGTREAPYLISNALQLGAMSYYSPSAHYRLTASIDLSGICWGTPVVPRFGGMFDGDGLTISHLTMEGEGQYMGLFGQLVYTAEVKDLGVEDVSITAGSRSFVGGLVGDCAGTVIRCYTTGLVTGGSVGVGGLVGYWGGGDLIDCYSTASVIGPDGACDGCLVGYVPRDDGASR